MKEYRIFLIIAVLVAAASAGLTYAVARGRAPADQHAEACPTCEAEKAENVQTVVPKGLVVEPAILGESWHVVSATGKVGPNVDRVVKVGSRIAGKVVSVSARVGDLVARGQALAVVSSVELAEARAAYRRAAARVKAAERSYAQQSGLAKLGAFGSRPHEEAKAEHASALSELAQARADAAQCEAELARAQSELAQCSSRLARARELYRDQIVSRQDLESAEAEHRQDLAEVEAARSKVRQAEAKVQQAEARSEVAKTYLEREQKIFGSNLLASKEVQSARAELDAARIELSAAADAIRVLGASPEGSGDRLAITSPISGRVVERSPSLGQMVDPSDILFTVMDLASVWVEANVYEKDMASIRKGQTVEIHVASYPDAVFSGRVDYVGDVLDAASRTARIRCAVSNREGKLKPEMFASVSIITARRGRAVLAPKQAVLDEGGGKIVFVKCADCPEDRKAGKSVCGEFDKREVEIGPAHDGGVEVVRGIEPGEEVVTAGQYQLKTALGSGKLQAGCADER